MCTSSMANSATNTIKKNVRNPMGLKIGSKVAKKLYNEGEGSARLFRTDTYEKPTNQRKKNV